MTRTKEEYYKEYEEIKDKIKSLNTKMAIDCTEMAKLKKREKELVLEAVSNVQLKIW
jgi:hypothetical protein